MCSILPELPVDLMCRWRATPFLSAARISDVVVLSASCAVSYQAVGDSVSPCRSLQADLLVRAQSPALLYGPSLCRPTTSRLRATRRRAASKEAVFHGAKKRAATPCIDFACHPALACPWPPVFPSSRYPASRLFAACMVSMICSTSISRPLSIEQFSS